MKRRDLIKKLRKGGYEKVREGNEHTIYAHKVTAKQIAIPRHREVNERTAKNILKDAGLE